MKNLFVLLLIFFTLTAFQNPDQLAKKEFEQIQTLVNEAKELPPEQAINKLNKAISLLNLLEKKYSTTNIAAKIRSGEQIKGISLNSIRESIIKFYQKPFIVFEDVSTNDVIFSADGSKIYAYGFWIDEKIFQADGKLIDATVNKGIRSLNIDSSGKNINPKEYKTSLLNGRFSSDGTRFIIQRYGADSYTIEIWDVINEKIDKVVELDFEENYMRRPIISPDGKKVLFGENRMSAGLKSDEYNNVTVTLWDLETKEKLQEFGKYTESALGVFSPDGSRVITFSGYFRKRDIAHMWDAKTGALLAIFKQEDMIPRIKFSPDGTKLITISYNGTVRLWNVATGELIKSFEEEQEEEVVWPRKKRLFQVDAIFSPDGEKILKLFQHTPDKLYDIKTGELIATFDGLKEKNLNGEKEGFKQAVFSPNASKVFIISNQFAFLWDVATGKKIIEYIGVVEKLPHPVIRFSPDGTKILIAALDNMNGKPSLFIYGVPTNLTK